MNTVEQNILLLTQNNIALLGQMGPARNDMAVVEPVMVPEPPEPPDMAAQSNQIHNEVQNMDIGTDIINDLTNELNQPMIDVQISVEEEELEHTEERNTDSIDEKILFNNIN